MCSIDPRKLCGCVANIITVRCLVYCMQICNYKLCTTHIVTADFQVMGYFLEASRITSFLWPIIEQYAEIDVITIYAKLYCYMFHDFQFKYLI